MPLSRSVFEARLTKLRYVHEYEIECDEHLRLVAVSDLEREDRIPVALISEALRLGWLDDFEKAVWSRWLTSGEEWRANYLGTAIRYSQKFVQNHVTIEWDHPIGPRVGAGIHLRLSPENPPSDLSKIIEEGSISRLLLIA